MQLSELNAIRAAESKGRSGIKRRGLFRFRLLLSVPGSLPALEQRGGKWEAY
jgi:hypothetical protein